MRARSAKLVLRNVSKVFAARLNFASICAAVSGSNVFRTSPVAGLIDAIAMFIGPPELQLCGSCFVSLLSCFQIICVLEKKCRRPPWHRNTSPDWHFVPTEASSRIYSYVYEVRQIGNSPDWAAAIPN